MAHNSPVDPSINLKGAELLKRLKDFGNALLHPPTSNMELLVLLDEFEVFLSWISQDPGKEVILSLDPSAKALFADKLLRNSNEGVQIAALCCIHELTRITAPSWPYEDILMKEFFLLFVQSLGRLSLMDENYYIKVTSALHTMARIQSGLVMTELQMEGPIIEMFEHFLSFIQSKSSSNMHLDMVTIMSTIMEDSLEVDWIPMNLLGTLLANIKKEKQEGSPTSWAFGVQILQELAAKNIRPCLAKVLQSLDLDVNEYADIVASICRIEIEKEANLQDKKAVDLEITCEAENACMIQDMPQQTDDGNKLGKKRERKPNSLFKLEEGYDFTGFTDEPVYLKSSCDRKNYKQKHNSHSSRKSITFSSRRESSPDTNICRKDTSNKSGSKVNQDDPKEKQVSSALQVVQVERSRVQTVIPIDCDEESTHQGTLSQASGMSYGEKLVGCKIKVWWPMDQKYYEGLVDSFDLSTMKHKILYDDGDEEILNLMGEDWELVNDAMLLDGHQSIQGSALSYLNPSEDGPSSKKMKLITYRNASPVTKASMQLITYGETSTAVEAPIKQVEN